MNEKDPLNVIVTGVGGQGNVLVSQFMGRALVRAGYHVTIGETYGASQRGGAVMSHLRISRQAQYGPLIPSGQANVILGLEPVETLRVLAQYGNPAVTVITNSRPVYPLAVAIGAARYPTVDEIMSALEAAVRQRLADQRHRHCGGAGGAHPGQHHHGGRASGRRRAPPAAGRGRAGVPGEPLRRSAGAEPEGLPEGPGRGEDPPARDPFGLSRST